MIQLGIMNRGGSHAGRFCGSGRIVFVHLAGGAGACEPSTEEDTGTRSGCFERDGPWVGEALRERRTSLDPSGTIAERLAAASVLRHSVGTPVDGATGL